MVTSTMKCLFFAVFCYIYNYQGATALTLPDYIPKCAFNDSNLSKCIQDNANLAIPLLSRGDPGFGLPVLSPLRTPRIEFLNNNFDLTLYNATFDNFKDFRITYMFMDPDVLRASCDFNVPFMNLSGQYRLSNGNMLKPPISGRGKAAMFFEGNTVKYSTTLDHYEKDGGTYARCRDSRVTLSTKRARFHFDSLRIGNLTSLQTSLLFAEENVNQLVDRNWQNFFAAIKPGMEAFLLKYIQIVVGTFHEKVPIENYFT